MSGGVTVCDRCGERVAALLVDDHGECLGCREGTSHCDPRLATDGGVREDDRPDDEAVTVTLKFDKPVTRRDLREHFEELADRLVEDGG